MSAKDGLFSVSDIRSGDEVIYAKRKNAAGNPESVFFLQSQDGSKRVGIEIINGLPHFSDKSIVVLTEEWDVDQIMLFAKLLSIGARLGGKATLLERGSVSTTYNIRLGE